MKKIFAVIVIFISIWLFWYTLVAQAQINPSRIFVCSEVLMALGKIGGDSEVKNILIKGLTDKEFFIRAYAAEALGKLIKDKEVISLLKTLVNDENYLVRILATKALVKLGEADMEELLLNFLSDEDPVVRANAVEQLGDFQDKYLFELAKVLSEDDSYLVRIKAIEQLGKNKFSPAANTIRQAIKDENTRVRQAACVAIGNIGDKEALPLLIERLNDEDIYVRAAAKVGISLLGEKEPALIKLFWQDVENKDPILQASSFIALTNFKDINILPVLLKKIIAPEESTIVRREAARALMILKPDILKLIKQALIRSKTKGFSLEDLEVSYKVDGKNLVSVFIEALKDEKNPLYQDAPFILTELKEELSLPALREALLQKDPGMVAAAAFALGKLRDKDAVKYLIEVCKKYGCG